MAPSWDARSWPYHTACQGPEGTLSKRKPQCPIYTQHFWHWTVGFCPNPSQLLWRQPGVWRFSSNLTLFYLELASGPSVKISVPTNSLSEANHKPRPAYFWPVSYEVGVPQPPLKTDHLLKWLTELRKVCYLLFPIYYTRLQLENNRIEERHRARDGCGWWGFHPPLPRCTTHPRVFANL